MNKKIFNKLLWSILAGVFALLFVGVMIGTWAALNVGYAAINMAFGTSNIRTEIDPDAELSFFYKSDYYDVQGDKKVSKATGKEFTADELFDKDLAVIEEVESEGITLLWNKDALPLGGNEKVSCLSHSSVDLVETGSGSGWVDSVSISAPNTSNSVDLKTALKEVGFDVNDTLWNFYKTGAGRSYTRVDPQSKCTEGQTWAVNEVPQSVYTKEVTDSYSTYGDVAFVVLSRSGGEYSDLHYSSTENKKGNSNGNYLALTTQEKALLDSVKSNYGTNFKKTVLLLNTANPLQFADLEPYYDCLDACLWIGQVGTAGARAVAKVLAGKSPSGRLPDTYAYDNESAPATENDGSYQYSGDCSGLNESGNGIYRQRMYMVYQEGIYVGYKYYETRYEDTVLGAGDASSEKGAKHSDGGWDYESEVAFPFGYGLSYTKFEYSGFKVTHSGSEYKVSVNVKNTGAKEGKETVQVYLQKPYTDFDKQQGVEKAAVELAGYAKTATLAPGASETVEIVVPEEYFKTYDANRNETYILEKGTYYLTVGTNAHVAANNILAKKGKSVKAAEVFGGELDAVMGDKFVEEIEIKKDDLTKYKYSSQTGYEIKNRFDSGDWNKYEHNGGTSVTYLSRSDWSGTYPSAPQLSMNPDLKADLAYDRDPVETEGAKMPTYGEVKGDNGAADTKLGDLVIFQFIDAPLYPEKVDTSDTYELNGKVVTYAEYWNYMWDTLLNQMTFEEQALICSNAYHRLNGAVSVGMPETKQENGPVGITKRAEAIFSVPNQRSTKTDSDISNMTDYQKAMLIDEYKWVAYPCAPIVAATFNNELVEKMGRHKSEDMLYLGYNGIYGPGVNMHRSPFGGRNFEYPSEDSVLAGVIEYYESKGIESKGCLAYAKHYALNDMETNRRHCGIWSNEQATREIYLRAFELTFAEGGAHATMNSFTRVGARWCGASYAMMTEVLRNEWGFEGVVISDWDSGGSMSKVDGILGGTDSFDGNGTKNSFDKWKNSPAVAAALREATRRIIYNVVHTNAMNGTTISMRTVRVTPFWQKWLYAIDAIIGVLFVGCAVMCALSWVFAVKAKKAEPQTSETEKTEN